MRRHAPAAVKGTSVYLSLPRHLDSLGGCGQESHERNQEGSDTTLWVSLQAVGDRCLSKRKQREAELEKLKKSVASSYRSPL